MIQNRAYSQEEWAFVFRLTIYGSKFTLPVRCSPEGRDVGGCSMRYLSAVVPQGRT